MTALPSKRIAVRISEAIKLGLYHVAGRTPWTAGYVEHRLKTLWRALHNQSLLDAFRNVRAIPTGYAVGLDERLVEYPWLLSRLGPSDGNLLDAGAVLNQPWILESGMLGRRRVVIGTLAPESYVVQSANVSYLYGDLRETVLRSAAFDEIVCLSTLEHVGMDNTVLYTADRTYQEAEPLAYLAVVRELKRLLRPGKKLFVSVPFGRPQNHGWFQQFTRSMVERIVDTFSPAHHETTMYQYTREGWQLSNMDECRDCEYFDCHLQGRRRHPDLAAAARAVACIELIKPT